MTDYRKISEDIMKRHSETFKQLYISELKDQIADKDEMITAQDHIIAEQKAEIDQNRIDLEEYRLDVKRLETALREIAEADLDYTSGGGHGGAILTARAALEERT